MRGTIEAPANVRGLFVNSEFGVGLPMGASGQPSAGVSPPGRRSVAAAHVNHASATTHPESGIARQRTSRRPAMVYPHPVADAPFPPITGKRSSPLCTAVRSRVAAHSFASQHQPSAQRRLGSGHCRTLRGSDLHFVPLGPPREGERPSCVGASNDRLCWESAT